MYIHYIFYNSGFVFFKSNNETMVLVTFSYWNIFSDDEPTVNFIEVDSVLTFLQHFNMAAVAQCAEFIQTKILVIFFLWDILGSAN